MKKVGCLFLLSTLPMSYGLAADSAVDTVSFMITNDGLNRGEVKIRQREDLKSPFLIIGCNNKSDDFYISIGNVKQADFSNGLYKVNYTFNNKTYNDTFIPSFMNDNYMLTKKANSAKENQKFVYNYILENKVVFDFGKNIIFYFNAKNSDRLKESLKIIISHCEMNFE